MPVNSPGELYHCVSSSDSLSSKIEVFVVLFLLSMLQEFLSAPYVRHQSFRRVSTDAGCALFIKDCERALPSTCLLSVSQKAGSTACCLRQLAEFGQEDLDSSICGSAADGCRQSLADECCAAASEPPAKLMRSVESSKEDEAELEGKHPELSAAHSSVQCSLCAQSGRQSTNPGSCEECCKAASVQGYSSHTEPSRSHRPSYTHTSNNTLTDHEHCSLLPEQPSTSTLIQPECTAQCAKDTSCRPDCVGTHLAYVMCTSGTTGEAKTVAVPHQCIVPNIRHLRQGTIQALVAQQYLSGLCLSHAFRN